MSKMRSGERKDPQSRVPLLLKGKLGLKDDVNVFLECKEDGH